MDFDICLSNQLTDIQRVEFNALTDVISRQGMRDAMKALPKQTFVATLSGRVVGCAVHFIEYDSHTRYVYIYVLPEYRTNGAGTALLCRLCAAAKNSKTLTTSYDNIDGASFAFLSTHGFTPTYSAYNMRYLASQPPEYEIPAGLTIAPYTDDMFMTCASIENRSFAELRQTCNIRPYVTPINEELRRFYAENNVFVMLRGREVLGKIEVPPTQLDNLCIRADMRGNGLGKVLFCFGVAEFLRLYRAQPTFWVLSVNERAIGMYTRCGCEPFGRRDYFELDLSK